MNKLDDAQLDRLVAELDRGPAAQEWAGWTADQRWTLARVAALIRRLFGVAYTLRGVSYLLHRIGWSPQVPTAARSSVTRTPSPRDARRPGRRCEASGPAGGVDLLRRRSRAKPCARPGEGPGGGAGTPRSWPCRARARAGSRWPGCWPTGPGTGRTCTTGWSRTAAAEGSAAACPKPTTPPCSRPRTTAHDPRRSMPPLTSAEANGNACLIMRLPASGLGLDSLAAPITAGHSVVTGPCEFLWRSNFFETLFTAVAMTRPPLAGRHGSAQSAGSVCLEVVGEILNSGHRCLAEGPLVGDE